jgi:hypothetical protein
MSMGAFTVITIFGIITLASTYSIITIFDDDAEGFFKSMGVKTMSSYLLTLGDYDTDFEKGMAYFLFVFGTVFLTLTMLNLVIALMSDAYEEVMSGISEQDTSDTNLMIIEMEKFYFWKRNSGQKTYFYSMDYATETSGDWKSQVQFVTQYIQSS